MADEPVEEYYQFVGELISMSSFVDLRMFLAFKLIAGCPLSIGRAIYYTLDSFNAKRAMLMRVAEAAHCPPEEIDCLKEIVRAAKSANGQRQKYAHISVEPTTRKGKVWKLTMRDMSSLNTPIPEREMDNTLEILTNRSVEIREAYHRLEALVSARREREKEYLEQ